MNVLVKLSSVERPCSGITTTEEEFAIFMNELAKERQKIEKILLSDLYVELLVSTSKKVNMRKSQPYVYRRMLTELIRNGSRPARSLLSYILLYTFICGFMASLYSNKNLSINYEDLEI